MDYHGVTDTGSLLVFHLQAHSLQGVNLDYFHIQSTLLYGIGQINGGEGVTGRAHFGLFWLVVEHGTTVSG